MHFEQGDTNESQMKVRVINDYGDDSLTSAILLSMPSMWMTGFVVYRLYRLKKEGRSLIDSTPSYVWNASAGLEEEG